MNATDDDLFDVTAFNYYHGGARGTKVSKQHKEADRGLKRRVSFDLGRKVAFEAPKFNELAIPTRPIRALGKPPSLKLKVKKQTTEEERIERQRIEEEMIEAERADEQFDGQRGDAVMELLSPDTLKALAMECGEALDAMDVEADVSDLDLSSTS